MSKHLTYITSIVLCLRDRKKSKSNVKQLEKLLKYIRMQSNVFTFLFLKCFECNNIECNILIILYINIDSKEWIIFIQKDFIEATVKNY